MNVDGYIRGESDVLPEFLSHIDFLYARYKGYVSSGLAYYIFRRKELVNIGGFVNFPAAWASDDATVICLSKKGMVSHNDALFAFRTSDLNISSAKNNTKMLLNKMIAIESFFRWFESELKEISVVDKDDIEKLEQILTSLSSSAMLDSMVWLITASDRRAVLSCWFVLCKVKSLSILERIMICGRAYIRIIVREIRDFFKR